MKACHISIIEAPWERYSSELMAVRTCVFVEEQNVPVELERDAQDPLSEHALAMDAEGMPVATGRLTSDGHIGRMAVVASLRGQGIGGRILQTLIKRARALGYTQIELHAQVEAIGFYQQFGFHAYGDTFMEAGIQHRCMRRIF